MGDLNLGSFVIPLGPVYLAAAMFFSLAVGNWAGRSRGVNVEPLLWTLLLIAVLSARAAFVAIYFDMYRKAPWSIIDVRDGGFFGSAGIAVLIVSTAILSWFRRESRKPLALGVGAGIVVWLFGAILAMAADAGLERLPQVELTRLDGGGTVQLKSLIGKPVVVNMWATWCPPCRREMPVLRDAQARYQDIVFVFANQGESADAVRSFLDAARLSLTNVLLDFRMQVGNQTGSMALPTTLFFNEKGVLVARRTGELSAATLSQRIDSILPSRLH